MNRYGIAVLGLAALAGCESSMGPTANRGVQDTVLAASAGSAQFPQNAQVSADVPIVALVNRDGAITLINPTDQPMQDIRVWVNDLYMQPVDMVDQRSMVSLQRDNFYNSQGYSLRQENAAVERVVIQTADNRLLQVHGPVFR